MPELGIELLVDGLGFFIGRVIGFWVLEASAVVFKSINGFDGDLVFADFTFLVGRPLIPFGKYPDDFDLVWECGIDFEEHGVGLCLGFLEAWLPYDAVGG